jgi:FAD-dependent oxidoreductase domain-containing protein 1
MGVDCVKAVAQRVSVSGQSGEVEAVVLADGSEVRCDVLVNALGPSCADLVPQLAIPVHRRKRCVFYFDCPEPLPSCPMLIDSRFVPTVSCTTFMHD